MIKDYFLSCDWGTSNFRLRLVAIPSLKIIVEDASDKGISDTFKAWQASGEKDENKRKPFYLEIIKESLAKLEESYGKPLGGIPIVISGMASSTIGMVDLPYQSLPFSIDGTGLKTQSFSATSTFDHELIMISGVKSNDDVMRGEETQLVGSITDEMKEEGGTQLFIHPGTHSKHITIEGEQVTGFKTYMTGEFFKVLTTHGILRDNVEKAEDADDSMYHFEQGVAAAVNTNLLHSAFKVRTNDLFRKMTKSENYTYLSGLLIGTELIELKNEKSRMYLGCGATLFNYYKTAIDTLGLTERITILPASWIDESVIRGQYTILNNQSNSAT